MPGGKKGGCLGGRAGPAGEPFGGGNIRCGMSFSGLWRVFWGYAGSCKVQEMSSALQSLMGAGLPLTSSTNPQPEGKSWLLRGGKSR